MEDRAAPRDHPTIRPDHPPRIPSWTSRAFSAAVIFACAVVCTAPRDALASVLAGNLTDMQGNAVPRGTIRVVRLTDSSLRVTDTDQNGHYRFDSLDPGEYQLTAAFDGFQPLQRVLVLGPDNSMTADLHFAGIATASESITVAADASEIGVLAPDPAQRVMIRDETLDANPGRPGMPVSIPGMPAESPAGGVKPPQYFVPGVAGDHGEPIAMFFQVGGYLFENNLPANAHGNGYADPNVIIPAAIDSVETDGGAFNVREGNNSENAAIVFNLRDRVEPMVRLTGDYRDLNLVAGWSPANPANKTWVGVEVSIGNGFLKRLEHRKQFKGNVSRVFNFGSNELMLYGIGYHGFAYQPGLIPIDTVVPGDTIDDRQQEETSNGALIFNNIWHATPHRQLQFSGFYRYYTLDVRPNFGYIPSGPTCGSIDVMPDCGNGLIRQSEHRNVNSENVLYIDNLNTRLSLLAGVDFRREAPNALNLDRADNAGVFYPVTANNLVLNFASPFVAVDGSLNRFVHYNLGYRRDQVAVDNQDIYRPADSFSRSAPVNSPKGTLTLFPLGSSGRLPTIAYSYGQSFHVNDPRIGTTAIEGGTIVSKARSNQLVVERPLAGIDMRLTFEHVTTAQSLARISNDTGLQENEGPGILKSLVITARRNFARGFVQGSYARADARDRLTGEATPEAPRLIWDLLAADDKLPAHLMARGEYEYVGKKPLGDGFAAVPVREFRGAVLRSFEKKGFDVGLNIVLSSGYAGQTLETLALPGEGTPFERITGFPLKSYVSTSFTYRLGKQ